MARTDVTTPAQLDHLAYGLNLLFLFAKGTHNLWGRPVSIPDLQRQGEGWAEKGTPQYDVRIENAFSSSSLTVSYYVVRSLVALNPEISPDIEDALVGLAHFADKAGSGGYGTSWRAVGTFGMEHLLSPRHTAAALLLFDACGKSPPLWDRSVDWLLKNTNSGGWADIENGKRSDCDSTAAVACALRVYLERANDVSEVKSTEVKGSILRGLVWLKDAYGSGGFPQWHYLKDYLEPIDSCYVISHIVEFVDCEWVPSELRAFIAKCVNDTCDRLNQDGSLGKIARHLVPNTAWALSMLSHAARTTLQPNVQDALQRVNAFLQATIQDDDRRDAIGLIEWAAIATAWRKLGIIRLSDADRQLMKSQLEMARPSVAANEYPADLLESLPRDTRRLFGKAYAFCITKGQSGKSSVFLSYRRGDCLAQANRLRDALVEHFDVFLDTESLDAGSLFPERIRAAISQSSVLVVVIGRRWFTWTRILNPWLGIDFVVEEVALALEGSIPIIPVLVDGARMPSRWGLPKRIQSISAVHALPLRSGPDFRRDVLELIVQLRETSHKVVSA